MRTLHDILWDSTVDILNFRLKIFKVKPVSQKKADCIEAIKLCYAGNGLSAVFSSLDEMEQLAVAESCHAPGCRFDERRFKAKHGSVPLFNTAPKKNSYGYRDEPKPEFATRLNLLLFPVSREYCHTVPSDLAERLREFVLMPGDAEIKTLDEPGEEEGLTVRLTEYESLLDLKAMLHLAEQGNLKVSDKTGMPSATGSLEIHACLSGGDFYPQDVACAPKEWSHEQQIGHIKPVAWALLLQNAGWISHAGSKSKLSPAGIKALRQAPHDNIRALWNQWLPNSKNDEFNRVNDIKGQSTKKHMTAKPPRREAIVDALSECPVGRWIDVEDFSNFMQATNRDFEITSNPWHLYLCEHRYGNFDFSGYGEWNILQFRYILTVLFEYAATLGLIDIAYVHPDGARDDFRGQWGADDMKWLSRYDGLRAFRITDLGAWCLGLTEVFTPSQPVSSLKLSVLPSLTITVVSGQPSPADRLLLDTWAEPETRLSWRLHPERATQAVERGQSARDFAAFLASADDQPLPQSVEGFLKASETNGTALRRKGDALVFDCRDAQTADMVCSRKELLDLCFRIGEHGLVVPTEHETKFRKVVRELGLGIV